MSVAPLRLFLLSGSRSSANETAFEIDAPEVFEARYFQQWIDAVRQCSQRHVQLALLRHETAEALIVRNDTSVHFRRGYTAGADVLNLTLHFLPHCPYTEKALQTLVAQFQGNCIITATCVRPEVKEKHMKMLMDYIQKHTVKVRIDGSTLPQFFYKGVPLGGASSFMTHLRSVLRNR